MLQIRLTLCRESASSETETASSGKSRPVSPSRLTEQRAEAALLAKIFHKARQIIFLPLWDAGGGRWYLAKSPGRSILTLYYRQVVLWLFCVEPIGCASLHG